MEIRTETGGLGAVVSQEAGAERVIWAVMSRVLGLEGRSGVGLGQTRDRHAFADAIYTQDAGAAPR